MCKLPTDISPVVLRLPHLPVFEAVAAGLRADVKRTAIGRGHRMTSYNAGDSRCMDCGMTVSVYHLHPFVEKQRGLAYKGTALDKDCTGELKVNEFVTRVPVQNRARPRA